MPENKPNFLMVGTAKSATTSIAKYLNQHPDIFIPQLKEPRYFIHDIIANLNKSDPLYNYLNDSSIHKWDEYLELFNNSTSDLVGEASVQYLYHYDTVISKVKEKLGDIKIIIVLRNPIDRAYSNYKYQFRQLGSFESALEKENKRIDENYNSFWFYKKMGLYYKQIHAYKENFSNVHICFYDDLIEDKKEFMIRIYKFLNVESNFVNDFTKKYNVTNVPKNKMIKYIVYLLNKYKIKILPLKTKKILKSILFTKHEEKMNHKTYQYLKEYFVKDIKSVESLVNRDLSDWYK